ncbi:hypothetical protein KR084_011861, partial [Drosophila pseudotakahashii]
QRSFHLGVLAMVIAASLSSAADNDVISDRRFRWEFSQDSDESANDLQEDDAEDDDDQDDSGSDGASNEVVYEYIEYDPESSESDESATKEA